MNLNVKLAVTSTVYELYCSRFFVCFYMYLKFFLDINNLQSRGNCYNLTILIHVWLFICRLSSSIFQSAQRYVCLLPGSEKWDLRYSMVLCCSKYSGRFSLPLQNLVAPGYAFWILSWAVSRELKIVWRHYALLYVFLQCSRRVPIPQSTPRSHP